MSLSEMNIRTDIPIRLACRQSPVVVIPVFNGLIHLKKCLDSLIKHTPPYTDVLVIDDFSDDPEAIAEIMRQFSDSSVEFLLLRKEKNEGYVKACNDAFELTGRRDVILLNSDCIVGPGWYERLGTAANSSNQIATVSVLTNHGTILSVPSRNQPSRHLPEGLSVDDAATRIAQLAARLTPEIPVAVGHCLYVRRLALDLVGQFDPAFGKGYGEEVDFSLRCVEMGLRNVCADDVFVFHHGKGSFGSAASQLQLINEKVVHSKYPYYQDLLETTINDPCSDLACSLDVARISLMGLHIGVDARKLGPQLNGTQTVITQTLLALGNASSELPITAYHLSHFDPETLGELSSHPNIRWLSVSPGIPTEPEVDVVFRPCQVDSYDELKWLHAVGRRVVIYQLDTIAYSNPSYFESGAEWTNYQELTRLSLATADGVATVSDFSGCEITRKQLIPDSTRLKVVHHGASVNENVADELVVPPPGFDQTDRPFMLCIGVSYRHKNRRFCLNLIERLNELGWDGNLVLVGASPPYGGTSHEEATDTLGKPSIRDRVINLESVSEGSKRWLYQHASLSLYPSVVEGFGLVPFESSGLGTPVLASRLGSLEELLGDQALLDTFDIEKASQTALHLMSCKGCRTSNIDSVRGLAQRICWVDYAVVLLQFLRDVLRRPKNRLAMEIAGRNHALFELAARDVARQNTFHKTILMVRRFPVMKRVLSPDGSRRQQLIRNFVNWMRRKVR